MVLLWRPIRKPFNLTVLLTTGCRVDRRPGVLPFADIIQYQSSLSSREYCTRLGTDVLACVLGFVWGASKTARMGISTFCNDVRIHFIPFIFSLVVEMDGYSAMMLLFGCLLLPLPVQSKERGWI
ncbi:hypothetical protein K402DRAFT_75550 [Aulographum hederae CBS 113979]|uniref:Uncharacterized protein n=1 Tax=Aulographum hederae CBS 113979 TaxID=1176131 RepID=A0A6G1HFG3_9PEZI|nr:hypothetical protein K402DRAFT_75550 [Aulographum hederae CBS 113979]